MSGHTMRVTFDRDVVHLEPVCHEPSGSICRVTCPQGCEEFNTGHEHGLEHVPYCNAVEFLTANDEVNELCDATRPFPLHDGMLISVLWNGGYYTWSPIREPNGGAS